MKQKSFTMVEVLLTMAIIGTLAFLTANGLSSIKASKVEFGFKNCYKVMVETYNRIITDETIIPNIEAGTDSTTGRPIRTPMCTLSYPINGVEKWAPQHFADAFVDSMKVIDKTSVGSVAIQKGYVFEAKNGSYWQVQGNPDSMSCYMKSSSTAQGVMYITFDVNGLGEGTNCPYTGETFSSKVTSCSEPDTFRFYVSAQYTLEPDTNTYYNGKNLKTYMEDKKLVSVNN